MERLDNDGEYFLNGDDPLEDELDYDDILGFSDSGSKEPSPDDSDDVSDWETDDDDEVIIEKQERIDKARKVRWHSFLTEHGLFSSHAVRCDFERLTKVIPNFIGGALPRSDKGDRAAYCMTMQTLFKPWRSPIDLRDQISTWDQAFREHSFSERQLQLMRNFDVRYECNNARDDHYAQMKSKLAEAKSSGKSLFPVSFMGYKDKFATDLNEFDYGSDDDDMEHDLSDDMKGARTLKMMAEWQEIRQIMGSSTLPHAAISFHVNATFPG
jgi:hypothetical protein